MAAATGASPRRRGQFADWVAEGWVFSVPSLTFWGGIHSIGGTKVVVAEDGYRFLFDFGLEYAPKYSLFDDSVPPRRSHLVRDYLRLGYLPQLSDLYPMQTDGVSAASAHAHPASPPLAIAASAKPEMQLPGRTAVFVSHLHLDHCALMGCIAPAVPVLVPAAAYRMLQALQTCRTDGPEAHRPYFPVPDGTTMRLGPLAIQVLAVDHDTPGTSGLIIATSAGVVAYSSDLRLHGRSPHLTRHFANAARAARPAALLMEGTRLGEDRSHDAPRYAETDISEQMTATLAVCSGLGILSVYHRNPERIYAARLAATATGRTLALESDCAYIYAACGFPLAGIAVFLTSAQVEARRQGLLPAWLQRWLAGPDSPPVVTAIDIASDQDRFLLQLAYAHLPELVDLAPAHGSVYLHSGGEPLGGFDPAWGNLLRWLEAFSLSLVRVHASGHASPTDLNGLVQEIAPAALVPIHSLHPERLCPDHPRRHLPEYGRTVPITALGR